MKATKPSPELHAMMNVLLKDAPKPALSGDYPALLARNRVVQQLLAAKAQQAAEVAWPGFTSLYQDLINKESEYLEKVGPQC